jgi:hypothetical protein
MAVPRRACHAQPPLCYLSTAAGVAAATMSLRHFTLSWLGQPRPRTGVAEPLASVGVVSPAVRCAPPPACSGRALQERVKRMTTEEYLRRTQDTVMEVRGCVYEMIQSLVVLWLIL